MDNIMNPLLGGITIGVASSILFLGIGRISGISSILAHLLNRPTKIDVWKYFFLFGLLAGGILATIFYPGKNSFVLENSLTEIIVAGLLVGFGTRLGSGCTSGHGVCGISRLSKRSIVATMIFMAFGILTVSIKGVF
ncbi:YeeE/YedE family protein [Halobacteriovorax sp.]|uniref:YeeE/YedE family protein n=1 Tax=Halobacteriovorax sp. TaxID=2020862 RepID=UPI0035642F3B